jgi:hypothetical protein
MAIFLSILVPLVAVFAIAARMDRKRRRLNDTHSAAEMGHNLRSSKLDAKERGSRWGAGG